MSDAKNLFIKEKSGIKVYYHKEEILHIFASSIVNGIITKEQAEEVLKKFGITYVNWYLFNVK